MSSVYGMKDVICNRQNSECKPPYLIPTKNQQSPATVETEKTQNSNLKVDLREIGNDQIYQICFVKY